MLISINLWLARWPGSTVHFLTLWDAEVPSLVSHLTCSELHSQTQNRASDRSSSISDTSRCENGKRSRVRMSKIGQTLPVGRAPRCRGLPQCVSVFSLPIITGCLQGKVEVSLFRFGHQRIGVFSARVVEDIRQVIDCVLFKHAHPFTAGYAECSSTQLPQMAMHDSARWSHSWVTSEHLPALTCSWKAAQFILFELCDSVTCLSSSLSSSYGSERGRRKAVISLTSELVMWTVSLHLSREINWSVFPKLPRMLGAEEKGCNSGEVIQEWRKGRMVSVLRSTRVKCMKGHFCLLSW